MILFELKDLGRSLLGRKVLRPMAVVSSLLLAGCVVGPGYSTPQQGYYSGEPDVPPLQINVPVYDGPPPRRHPVVVPVPVFVPGPYQQYPDPEVYPVPVPVPGPRPRGGWPGGNPQHQQWQQGNQPPPPQQWPHGNQLPQQQWRGNGPHPGPGRPGPQFALPPGVQPPPPPPQWRPQ